MSDQEGVAGLPLLLASSDDLSSVDIDAVLGGLRSADDHTLGQALRQAAEEAMARGDDAAQRGYHLLEILCSFCLRVEDPADPWGPLWMSADRRTYIASDIRGEQTVILAGMVNAISHPALRARVADVVWFNDRKQFQAGIIAIKAYCELIERYLSGEYVDQSNLGSIHELVDWFHRALQINAIINKRDQIHEDIGRVFSMLYQHARDSGNCVFFTKIARLGQQYKLSDGMAIALDAERMAAQLAGGDYPLAVREVWVLAAQIYKELKNEDARRRCLGCAADETLRMREGVNSATAKARWTLKAIGELRGVGGFQDRILKLKAELRELQGDSPDELQKISIPIDLTKEWQGTVEKFSNLSLPDIFREFALFASSPRMDEVKSLIVEDSKRNVLSSIFGVTFIDHDGRVTYELPGGLLGLESNEDWIKVNSLRYLSVFRHTIFSACIEPARYTVMCRFPLQERHFEPIVSLSPFVPLGHEYLFALGFARFWQGDFVSAAHILIPQLESMLRYVLLNNNRDSSKINSDLTQEDRSISGLISNLRSDLETVFGRDIISEIDLLFCYKPGPALRHEIAHGKMSANEFYDADVVYACWLIYRLVCLPLLKYWDEKVAPAIERAAF